MSTQPHSTTGHIPKGRTAKGSKDETNILRQINPQNLKFDDFSSKMSDSDISTPIVSEKRKQIPSNIHGST